MFVRAQSAPSAASLPLGQTPASDSPTHPSADPFEAFVRRAVSQDAGKSSLPRHADATAEDADDSDAQAPLPDPGSPKPHPFAKALTRHSSEEQTENSEPDSASTSPSKPKTQPADAADLTALQTLNTVAPALLMSWGAPLTVAAATGLSCASQGAVASAAQGAVSAAGARRPLMSAATGPGAASKGLALSADAGLKQDVTELVSEVSSPTTEMEAVPAKIDSSQVPTGQFTLASTPSVSGDGAGSGMAKTAQTQPNASGFWSGADRGATAPQGGSAEFWSGVVSPAVSGADAPLHAAGMAQAQAAGLAEAGVYENAASGVLSRRSAVETSGAIQPQTFQAAAMAAAAGPDKVEKQPDALESQAKPTGQAAATAPISGWQGKLAAPANLPQAGVDASPLAKAEGSALQSAAVSANEIAPENARPGLLQNFGGQSSAVLPNDSSPASGLGAKVEAAQANANKPGQATAINVASDRQVSQANNTIGGENAATDSAAAGHASSALVHNAAELTLPAAQVSVAPSTQDALPADAASTFVVPQAKPPVEPQPQVDAIASALKASADSDLASQAEVQPATEPAPDPAAVQKGAGQKAPPGSAQAGKAVQPFGTAVAKEELSMKMAEKTSKTAELAQQKLPGNGIEGSERQNLTPQASATAKSSVRSLTAETGALSSAPTVNLAAAAPTVTAAATALPGQDSSRMLSLERIHDLASVHAMRLRDSGSDSLRVLIQPGNGIQLSLELRASESGIQAQALLNRGDYQFLSSQWSDLQQRLAPQGIHLAPLQCTAGFSGGQSHQQSNGHSTKDEPGAGAFAEFAFGGSMTDSPASRASRVKTHRGWETWA